MLDMSISLPAFMIQTLTAFLLQIQIIWKALIPNRRMVFITLFGQILMYFNSILIGSQHYSQ